jgi:putative NADH-flavin reductase
MNGRKLLILGATGGTGRHVVSRALDAGHEVTVFVRHPDGLIGHGRVRVITGDVRTDGNALAGAVRGQDAVISALGMGRSFNPHGLIQTSMPLIVGAMGREGVKRLIFTSAFGVGETFRDVPPVPRIFIRTLLRNIYADKLAGEAVLRRSTLDWTLVYPAGLTNKPATGRYRVGERLELRGLPTISREDLAQFLVTQVDDPKFVRKGVLIAI